MERIPTNTLLERLCYEVTKLFIYVDRRPQKFDLKVRKLVAEITIAEHKIRQIGNTEIAIKIEPVWENKNGNQIRASQLGRSRETYIVVDPDSTFFRNRQKGVRAYRKARKTGTRNQGETRAG